MIRTRGGKLASSDGAITGGDCPYCGCEGSPIVCICSSGSPWYGLGCNGQEYFKFKATFSRDTTLSIPIPDDNYVAGIDWDCLLANQSFSDFQNTQLASYRIDTPASLTIGEFVMTPANSYNYPQQGCSWTSTYRIVKGTPPHQGLLWRGTGLAIESSSTLQSPVHANADNGWEETYGQLRWSIGVESGLYRIRATWHITVYRNSIIPLPDLDPDPWRWFEPRPSGLWLARVETWTLLDAESELMTSEAICAATSITLSSAGGGSCVITNDGSIPPPANATGDIPECLHFSYINLESWDPYNPCQIRTTSFEDTAARVFDSDGTPYWINSATERRVSHEPGFGWAIYYRDPNTGDQRQAQVPYEEDGPMPHTTGGITYTGNAGAGFIIPTNGCDGEPAPCGADGECYQLSNDSTISITAGGTLSLYFNDNNFSDNPASTLEVAVYINSVLVYSSVEVPNDTADGVDVGSVSAGDSVRVVWTGTGYFDYGVAPMDAEGYFLSGDPSFPYEATDDFVCPGLLTWTLVAKVGS